MNTVFQWSMYLTGVLFVCAVSLVTIFFSGTAIIEEWKRIRELKFRLRLNGHLYQLRDWCSGEFPIVADVVENVLEYNGALFYQGAEKFREELRQKYPGNSK